MRKIFLKKSDGKKACGKGRRFLAGLLALLTALGAASAFVACEDVEDYVPASYGVWDGNYLYGGNAKIKTTGEDFTLLVSSVQTEYGELAVCGCIDYEIVGEKIYMALRLDNGEVGGSTSLRANALVVYDTKEKTQALIKYFDNGYKEDKAWDGETEYSVRISDIVCLKGEEVVLDVDIHKRRSDGAFPTNYEYFWIGVGADGSIDHETYAGLEAYRGERYVGGRYFISYEADGEKGLYYRTWENAEPICIFDGETGSVEFEYWEPLNGLFIKKASSVASEGYFYDFEQGVLLALQQKQGSGVEALSNGYFLTYDSANKTYKERNGCKTEEKQAVVRENCVLRRVVREENGESENVEGAVGAVAIQTVAELKADYNFTYDYEMTKDGVYFTAVRYRSASGLFDEGGRETAYFFYGFDKGKLTTVSSDTYRSADEKRENAIAKENAYVCGEYTYYLTVNMLKRVGGYYSMAITLTGEKDGKSKALQFGQPSVSKQVEGARFSSEFWSVVTKKGALSPYGRVLVLSD